MKRREYIDSYGNRAPDDATHFHTVAKLFLKADGGALYVREARHWALSMHKDGVSVLDNGECVPLPPVDIDTQIRLQVLNRDEWLESIRLTPAERSAVLWVKQRGPCTALEFADAHRTADCTAQTRLKKAFDKGYLARVPFDGPTPAPTGTRPALWVYQFALGGCDE